MNASQRFREFKMPDVGEGLTEAEILKWHVQPGDPVSDGQMVVEVETAKAAVELPIPYDGKVAELLFEEGATVDVGTPIVSLVAGSLRAYERLRVDPRVPPQIAG
jgi:2-oxoisovalerate dehydrogenase E2 component (dihydrolipoyl transacylase)